MRTKTRTRERLEQEIEELTVALAKASDAIATIDDSGSFAAVNPAFEALLGYAHEAITATPLIELVHEADRARVLRALGAHAEDLVARAIRHDGRIVPVELSLVPRAGHRGHFLFVRDLGQKQREGQLVAAAAITAVGSLANGLAHDINNPLGVVLANVEEAVHTSTEIGAGASTSAGEDLVELRAMLEEAYSASQRVQFLVRDLRPFACTEERRGKVDVNALVEACSHLVFAEVRRRARLEKHLGPARPVMGNEATLAQVILHVLVNAAHAIPEGTADRNTITLTTRQNESATEIEIADTGSGISAADLPHVFEPFFTTKARRPGMGLAISKAAVQAHGGEISIVRRDGGGTIVRIVLPTLEPDVADISSKQLMEDSTLHRRVLVVDDDPLVLRSLTRVLARDFAVASARNGREALDLVRAGGAFDAMLCDLVMPELSGIELHGLLERDDPELAKRTVFLTGGAFGVRAQRFLEAAGQPHLEKPVDMKTVRDLLMQLGRTASDEASARNLLVANHDR